MFVYSLRASSIKFFVIIAICICALLIVVNTGGAGAAYAATGESEINFSGIKSNEDRVAFIEGFGLKVNPTPVTEESYAMPDNFDRIIGGYNELQKSQGLDLTKYKGKRVTHYAYEVTNYDYDGRVLVNLCVYKGRIVACDISSADPTGFVSPLCGFDTAKIKKN